MYSEQNLGKGGCPTLCGLSSATTHLLGQWEEVLMQGKHGSVERSVVRVPGDHACVLLHAVPVSWGGTQAVNKSHSMLAWRV